MLNIIDKANKINYNLDMRTNIAINGDTKQKLGQD